MYVQLTININTPSSFVSDNYNCTCFYSTWALYNHEERLRPSPPLQVVSLMQFDNLFFISNLVERPDDGRRGDRNSWVCWGTALVWYGMLEVAVMCSAFGRCLQYRVPGTFCVTNCVMWRGTNMAAAGVFVIVFLQYRNCIASVCVCSYMYWSRAVTLSRSDPASCTGHPYAGLVLFFSLSPHEFLNSVSPFLLTLKIRVFFVANNPSSRYYLISVGVVYDLLTELLHYLNSCVIFCCHQLAFVRRPVLYTTLLRNLFFISF
jgi:hypothetical protein